MTGGKRSRYDARKSSAYAQANANLPDYLKRGYHKKAWGQGKDYSTGSYQTRNFDRSGKKSWFGGKKSNESGQVAFGSGKGYRTGQFQTGSSMEDGKRMKTRSSWYADSRDGWFKKKPTILSTEEYRDLTMNQAKSLLGN